jgi:hypothetical protein
LFLNIRQKLFDETKTKKNYNPLNSSPVINEKLKKYMVIWRPLMGVQLNSFTLGYFGVVTGER